MRKFIINLVLIFAFSLFFVPSVYAKKVNTEDLDFRFMKFNSVENPITYNYFVKYADLLFNKMDFKKISIYGVVEYKYMLHTDGTITDLQSMPLNQYEDGTKLDKYYRDIILNNTPPPYPKNMEIGDVLIYVVAIKDLETKTKLRFYRGNEGSTTPGNYVYIHLNKKSKLGVIIGKINETKWKIFD